MKSKEVIQAQLELILGYYNRIGFQKQCTREDILGWLESDKEFMEGEISVYSAEQIINGDTDNSAKR